MPFAKSLNTLEQLNFDTESIYNMQFLSFHRSPNTPLSRQLLTATLNNCRAPSSAQFGSPTSNPHQTFQFNTFPSVPHLCFLPLSTTAYLSQLYTAVNFLWTIHYIHQYVNYEHLRYSIYIQFIYINCRLVRYGQSVYSEPDPRIYITA